MLSGEEQGNLNLIADQMVQNEQETVRLNFKLGDLLNDVAERLGCTAKDAGKLMESASGIPRSTSDTNARIARRIPAKSRIDGVSWGSIKYLCTDFNPRYFKVEEEVFCEAVHQALCYAAANNLKLADLREKNGDKTLGEALLLQYLPT